MEIKDFQYLFFIGILIFCIVLYLGYNEMKYREALGEDVYGEIDKKWLQVKNPYLDDENIENFEDEEFDTEDDTEDDQKSEENTIEIDEEEDKKKSKKREGAKNIFSGIKKGIDKSFKKAGDSITKNVLKPITGFFKIIIKPILYIFDSVECGVHKIENIFVCMKWYLLQLFGIILYFPYRILFYLTGTTSVEKTMWNAIEKGDSIFHDFTGYHFAHYQDDVTNLCYKCCK
jgi:hypothetical protein